MTYTMFSTFRVRNYRTRNYDHYIIHMMVHIHHTAYKERKKNGKVSVKNHLWYNHHHTKYYNSIYQNIPTVIGLRGKREGSKHFFSFVKKYFCWISGSKEKQAQEQK